MGVHGMRQSRAGIGRPRIVADDDVVSVLRQLSEEGNLELSVAVFAGQIMRRLECSRASAYRAIRRVCASGRLRLPGY